MKLLIFLIKIYSVVSVQSTELPSEILQTITDINKHDLLKTPENLACSPKVARSRSDEINDCLVDLCGPAKKNESSFLNDENFEQYINENIKKGLAPLTPKVTALLSKFQKTNLEKLDLAEKMLDSLKLQSPNSVLSNNKDLQKEMSRNIFTPYLSDVIDLSKPSEDRYHVKVNIDPKNSKEFNENLLAYAKSYEVYVKNDFQESYKKKLFTKNEMLILIRESRNEIKKILKVDEVKKRLGDQIKAFDSIIYGSDLPESTSVESIRATLGVFRAAEVILKTNTKFEIPIENNLPTCSDPKTCSVIYDEHLRALDPVTYIRKQRSFLNDLTKTDHTLRRCQASIVANLSDTSDKNKAIQLLEETISDVIKNTLPTFSSHSQKVISEYLEKNIRARNKQLGLSASDKVKKYDDDFNKYLSHDTSNSGMDVTSFYSSLSSQRDSEVMSRDIDLLCGGGPGIIAFDAFLPNDELKKAAKAHKASIKDLFSLDLLFPLDKIYISDFSCHHEFHGKSIVAHELGHAISYIFSKLSVSGESAAVFKKIRECVRDNYVKYTPSINAKKKQEYDGQYTEEDMADVFASITYKDKSNLFSCALIETDTIKDRYVTKEFILPGLNDHSSTSLRVIMEAINKDVPLPKSCERALDSVKGELRLKKCAP